MAFDYAALKAEVPDVLIPQFGVAVTLTRPARAAVKSWQQDQGPAASTAAQSISGVHGIQVALDKATTDLETMEQRLGRWVLTAPSALPEEVGPEWSLVANGLTYPILSVQPVQPGGVLLLYFATVKL